MCLTIGYYGNGIPKHTKEGGKPSFLDIDSKIHSKIMRTNDQVNRLSSQIDREQEILDKKTEQVTAALAKMEAYATNNASSQATLFKINTTA